MPSLVALIPARAGSKRCPGKNIRLLGDQPLWQWTAEAARASGIFHEIAVCTDDPYLTDQHSVYRGRMVVRLFERAPVPDDQPDIEWVTDALEQYPADIFAILRPTSPFRTHDTIRRARETFLKSGAHCLRAVQKVTEHPGKMWQEANGRLYPLIGDAWPGHGDERPYQRGRGQPWHNRPTQTLPQVYVQNASLDMAWSYVIPAFGSITGPKVAAFITEGWEGFDINHESDWTLAEAEAHRRTAAGKSPAVAPI